MAKKDKKKKGDDEATEDAAAEEKETAAPADGAEGGEGGDGAKPKSKKKLIIIIAAALVVLGGAGGGAWFFLGSKEHEKKEEVKEKAVYYSMPEMIINLSATGKSTNFLKATVILELPNTLDAVAVEANLPRLMDAFNTYVRELRPSDLSGSAGITRLREELLLRANKALEPTKINDVLFKEIVVQ
jgi:flagellar FliL protein